MGILGKLLVNNVDKKNDHKLFLGVPEVLGQPAVIITWVFTVGYLFGYFFMVVMIVSYSTVLKRMSKKRIVTFYERRNQMPKRVFDNDQQSQLTFTERLSDSVCIKTHEKFKKNQTN